jgi:FMN reductase
VKITVVTGNPKPASRTHGVALAAASALAAALPGATTHLVADLAEHAPRLFDSSDAELSRLTAAVAAADVAADLQGLVHRHAEGVPGPLR